MQSTICFVSDFGLDDTWVGVCHAVIHRSCPQAHVVDMGHQIPPFDLRKGAATAAAAVFQIPDAIHLVVVDPGVGAGRKNICIVTGSGAVLVGPDNGVLLPATLRAGGISQVIAIDAAKIDFRSPLATFHARDILAPAAAALACGVAPLSLGTPIDAEELVPGPFGLCTMEGDHVAAEVLESDRFGSLRFNIPGEQLDVFGLKCDQVAVSIGHNTLVVKRAATFDSVSHGDPVLLVDSSGWLTLAVNRGDAGDRYGVAPGTVARLQGVARE